MISRLTLINSCLVGLLLLVDNLLKSIGNLNVELAESLVHLQWTIAGFVHVVGDWNGEIIAGDLVQYGERCCHSEQGKPEGGYDEKVGDIRHGELDCGDEPR